MNWLLNGTDITQYVSILPTQKLTQDESLDEGQIIVGPITNRVCFSTGAKLTYVDDNAVSHFYVIVSDQVQIADRATPSYYHTVQYAQNTRELHFHLVKGMDFAQPANLGMFRVKTNCGFYVSYFPIPKTYNWTSSVSYIWKDQIGISPKLKLTNAKMTMRVILVSSKMVNNYPAVDGMNYTSSYPAQSVVVNSVSGTTETPLFSLSLTNDNQSIELTPSQIALMQSAGTIDLTINATQPSSADLGQGDLKARLMYDITLYVSGYYYSYLNVLQGIINGAFRPTDSINTTSEAICSLPTSGEFFDFLNTTPAPDFQFNQGNTLYDCLTEVYRSFDGVPTMDENGVLGVEYLNQRNGAMASNLVAYAGSVQDENRTNGIVANYQNGSQKNFVSFPAVSGSWCQAKCGSLGVPQANDWYIPTPQAIAFINRCYVYCNHGEDLGHDYPINIQLDIDDFVVEKSAWSLLDTQTSTSANMSATQSNTFWYQKGQKGIYVGTINQNASGSDYAYKLLLISSLFKMTGVNVSPTEVFLNSDETKNDIWNLRMRVEYIPIQDGCLRVESPDDKRAGESLIGQSGAVIDLNKMGSNMLGLASRLGEETRQVVYTYSSASQVPQKGQTIIQDGITWVVQSVKQTISGNGIKCELQLTANYNQLSSKITLDRDIRYTGIDTQRCLSSETIYQEYVYFSLTGGVGTRVHFDQYTLLSMWSALIPSGEAQYTYLSSTSTISVDSIDFAVFQGNYATSSGTAQTDYVYMPILAYGAGNALCFEGGFDQPISAGNGLKVVTSWFNNLTSFAVYYTDARGFTDTANIWLCPSSAVASFDDYPLASEPLSSNVAFQSLAIEKRPNDIFKLNYEIIALPYQNSPLMIYSKLFEESYLASKSLPSKVRVFVNGVYSPFETKAFGTELTPTTGFKFSMDIAGGLRASLTLYDGDSQYSFGSACSSLMIADENGNALLAVNETIASGSPFAFYLFSSHNRL